MMANSFRGLGARRSVVLCWGILAALLPVAGRAVGAPAASVSITSTPPRAQVLFDGRHAGLTPLVLENVGYGKHLVDARKHQHVTVVRVLEVGEPTVAVEITLAPLKPGRIRVVSTPEGAEVFLNGSPRGKAPMVLDGLLPGRYEVRLEAESCFPFQESVTVDAGQESRVDKALESKSEAYLLDAIRQDPTRVANYYDLGHHYVMLQRFDQAFEMFGRGFDACVSPQVRTSEQRRLYDEYERIWDGQYNFADDATRQQLRPRMVDELEKATARQPRSVLNYWALADLYEKMEDWAKVAGICERGYQAVRTRRARLYLEYYAARARYHQGMALEKAENADEALALYESLVQAHPEAYWSRLCLSRIIAIWERRKRDPLKAVEARRRYLALYPDGDSCPEMLLEIAQAYGGTLKDPQKAIETYRAYAAAYPDRPGALRARMAIVSIYRNLKDTDSAIRECGEIVSRYPRTSAAPEALRALYEIYARLAAPRKAPAGMKEKAELVRQRLVTEYPWTQEAAGVDTDPASRKQRTEEWALYRQAAEVVKSDAAKAAAAYEELVRKHPKSSAARYGMSQMIRLYSETLKDEAKANDARRRFLELFPESETCPSILYQMAAAKRRNPEQFDEAVADLRRLVKEYPRSDLAVQAQYLIATLYGFSYGHYDREKNIEEYRRLIRDFPWYDGNDGAQLAIAMNFYYQTQPGDREKCRKELMRIIDVYPHGSSAAQAEYYLDLIDAGLQPDENRDAAGAAAAPLATRHGG